MKNAKRIVSFAMAVMMALTICAVAPATVARAEGQYPGSAGENSLALYVTMEPTSLSTLEATYGEEFKLLGCLDVGLTQIGEDDQPVPAGAESWEISDDALTYTFHLREDALWSNGDPVVASDYAFAWKTLMTPDTGAEYAYFGYQLIAGGQDFYDGKIDWEDVGVKVIDDYTLEVTLAAPTPYALSMFCFRSLDPINEKFFNEIGGVENYNMDPEYFCSNGPYTLESWTHDSELVMKKNEKFFDADKVSLETITWKILTQSDTKFNSFKAGDIDVIDLTGDQITELDAEGYPVNAYLAARDYWILFNNEDKYLSNVNLRKAIDACYSRTDFVNAIIKDSSVPANTFCPPAILANGASFAETALAKLEENGYAKDGILRNPVADPDKANEYLEKALEELGCTKEDLSAHLDIHCGDSDQAQMQAAFIQEAVRTVLGVEITVTPMQTKAQSAERTNGNYVMDLAGWGADYNDPMTFFDLWVTGAGNNSAKFSSEEYDALIKDALTNTDEAARVDDFIRCEEILMDEMPISIIYVKANAYAVSEKLTGGYTYTAWNSYNFKYATVK
ncbi:MAG: peptide ABC transporter substrate-binding protein [Clostridia bacterium]|nr:peptide ABC transporter substrate-binding protein [Clostridia bacterium]